MSEAVTRPSLPHAGRVDQKPLIPPVRQNAKVAVTFSGNETSLRFLRTCASLPPTSRPDRISFQEFHMKSKLMLLGIALLALALSGTSTITASAQSPSCPPNCPSCH